MSMHKKPLTPLEEEGLRVHHLSIGVPSQLSDTFRIGMAWAQRNSEQDLPIHKANTDKLAELALYCVQRKIGRGGQEAHEAIMLYCDALAAKIGMIKQWHEDCGRWPDTTQEMEKIELILNKSPLQCLAEIKAEAGRAGFIAGIKGTYQAFSEPLQGIVFSLLTEEYANQYAAKVRQGGE